MGSIICYISNEIHEYELLYSNPVLIAFIVALIPFIWFFLSIVYHLLKAYYLDKDYEYLDKMKDIQLFEKKTIEYYKSLEKNEEDALYQTNIDVSFEIDNKFIEATKRNALNNYERSGYLAKANKNLRWLLLSLLGCALPFIISFSTLKKPEKQRLELLIKQLEVKMSENVNNPKPVEGNSTGSTQSKPVKPVFPENTLIKESETPKNEVVYIRKNK